MSDIISIDQHSINLSILLLWMLLWRVFPKATAYKWLALISVLALAKFYFLDQPITEQSFLHLGLDLILVAAISIIPGVFSSKTIRMLYVPVGLILLQLGHNALTSKFLQDKTEQKMALGTDLDAELIVEITDRTKLKQFKSDFSKHIIAAEFLIPNDNPLHNIDEYILVNVKTEADFDALFNEISNTKYVKWVEPNQAFKVPELKKQNPSQTKKKSKLNDPLLGDQWISGVYDLDKMHNRLKKARSKDGKKALIAILDTGVDANHEDLKANFKSINLKDNNDPKGHGTHCAGIAAAVSNNNIGIASLIPDQTFVDVTSVKVLNRMGMGTQAQIIKGIVKAADFGADVISLSLGSPSTESKEKAYTDAVNYAIKKGAIVIAAAGNSAKNAKLYSPANTAGIIAVAAVDANLDLAKFSNTVEDLDLGIAAPGVEIMSTLPDNNYGKYNGTSMAAPFVAGLIGLMRSIDPKLDHKNAYALLKDSGIKKQGQLIVDPNATLKLLLQD